jgi:hypothetical protein
MYQIDARVMARRQIPMSDYAPPSGHAARISDTLIACDLPAGRGERPLPRSSGERPPPASGMKAP